MNRTAPTRDKIMAFLVKNEGKWFDAQQVAEQVGCNDTYVIKMLHKKKDLMVSRRVLRGGRYHTDWMYTTAPPPEDVLPVVALLCPRVYPVDTSRARVFRMAM